MYCMDVQDVSMYSVHICKPGGDERVTLSRVADGIFAFGQGRVEKQLPLGQHGEDGPLRSLHRLHTSHMS